MHYTFLLNSMHSIKIILVSIPICFSDHGKVIRMYPPMKPDVLINIH